MANNITAKKIGFWSVFALVTGSQIGTGIFMLPVSLAPYGVFSLIGWIFSAGGAIILSLVFARLCAIFPYTGGPHVYVRNAFGTGAAFFVGWTYWVVSWVSTQAVVVTAVSYLTPIIGINSSGACLATQVILLVSVTLLNLRGIKAAGRVEIILTLLKFIPLLSIALMALPFFDSANLVFDSKKAVLSNSQILGQVTLLTLWGFIGLESATTPAGSVENPDRTIPMATIFGTICVAVLYIINSVAIMGLIPGGELANSYAPYVDAAKIIFGGRWHTVISAIAALICIGTLNAWMIASSQILLGLAEDGLMPSCFTRKNSFSAPVLGIIIICIGIIFLLILTADEDIAEQVTRIIDFSVTAFLFVYLICSLALLKIILTKGERILSFQGIITIMASSFCSWVIYETSLNTLIIATLFVISGIPVYFFWYRKQNSINN